MQSMNKIFHVKHFLTKISRRLDLKFLGQYHTQYQKIVTQTGRLQDHKMAAEVQKPLTLQVIHGIVDNNAFQGYFFTLNAFNQHCFYISCMDFK